MAHFNKVGDQFSSVIRDLFSSSSSPESKKTRQTGSADTDINGGVQPGGRQLSPGARNPFDKKQTAWLQKALIGFGEAVENRFENNERTLTDLTSKYDALVESNKKLIEKLDKLQEEKSSQGGDFITTQAMEDALKKFEEEKMPSSSKDKNVKTPGLPKGCRVHAMIGGLGKGSPQQVKQRAIDALTTSRVPKESYSNLIPSLMDRDCWSAECYFTSPEALQDASFHVKAADLKGTDQKRIWLDEALLSHEKRPAKVIHRSFDMLSWHNEDRPVQDRVDLKKLVSAKKLFVGTTEIAYTLKGTLNFRPSAKSFFTPEQLDEAKEYGEDC